MKFVPGHIGTLEEQETYLLQAFLIIRFPCGSVVPCVETSREKPTTGNELFREANELEGGCGSQNKGHNKHGNDLFLTR